MLAYYNERAPEYEQAYDQGTGTSSIADPMVFTREISELKQVVSSFGYGHLVDLACGTAFWLPCYLPQCSRVTLFDQSENMLRQAEEKVTALSMVERCELLRGDIFDAAALGTYDCAFTGFFLSHVTDEQEHAFFQLLKRILRPGGTFLILDSAWTPIRAQFNQKMERQPRSLSDGRTFDILKKYFDRADIDAWAHRHDLILDTVHFGSAFLAVRGRFQV